MQPNDEPKSLLADLRPYHVVHVHNPLSDDFTWQVARSVPHDDPRYNDPYIDKLNLRNVEHPKMGHVTQKVTIPAGKSMKLPGEVAQVLVKHLVDVMMKKAGHGATLGNPDLRREFESQVILNRDDLRSRLSNESVEQQLQNQLDELNKTDSVEETSHATTESAFPGLTGADQTDPGLPSPDPTPGTGVQFTPGQKAAAKK